MTCSVKFKWFGKKVHMLSEGQMGIVIEKESQVICVYGTDGAHQNIFCAIPLCPPKYLRGAEYVVDFRENQSVSISVRDVQIVIDFANHKCATNKELRCFGSDSWGQDVQTAWDEIE